MLTKKQMQEIQDLKLRGFTRGEIIVYFQEQGLKPPTRPTIDKYYNMDVLPENPGASLAKNKVFDQEPFRSTIITVLETSGNQKCCISSVYDVLMEKFVENGDYNSLPGNEQTLRNYVHYLEKNKLVDRGPEHQRIYDYVFDKPPGDQMLIDFGQIKFSQNNEVHFICLLLRYSRLMAVFAQDHKYNAPEACTAIYRSFCKLGGRPRQLVIDQDAVFVANETYGEVVKTRIFEEFCQEQGLTLWVCNKADPESKGPIENTVGFVKKNFFSARKVTCIDEVWRALPGWLERKNSRIHRTILRIPGEVFAEIEKESLRPLLPSVYESSPSSFTAYQVTSMPYLLYKANKYSLPREYAYQNVFYKVAAGTIHIYDENRILICSHGLCCQKGATCRLPEHNRPDPENWVAVMERLEKSWNCYDFLHFINGIKKENPRHIPQQLLAIEQFLESERPSRQLVAQVLKACCEQMRYRFSQFREVYYLEKAAWEACSEEPGTKKMGDVEARNLEVYSQAFRKRVRETEVAVE